MTDGAEGRWERRGGPSGSPDTEGGQLGRNRGQAAPTGWSAGPGQGAAVECSPTPTAPVGGRDGSRRQQGLP